MAPGPKNHITFSPTNAPGDPSGGRGADFTWPRTCIFSVVAVFMDALSKACMAGYNQGCTVFWVQWVCQMAKQSTILPQEAVLAGIGMLTADAHHRARVCGEVHGRALRRAHGHWIWGLGSDTKALPGGLCCIFSDSGTLSSC